jgi:asparagine synthase (glutamine-hydrolysing)
MCGINGIALSSRSSRTISRELVEQMRDIITHRGPDDEGIFIDGNIGLGHRRLSIVDVAAGHQPMTNEDGSLYITYNGEIYNHADFREWLEGRGHVYKTHCDTETILHLYEEYGTACVDHLRGMFAFAIWDQRKQELFLARDRLGVKPLYYVHCEDGSLYFGSEIKTLLQARAVKPEINYAVIPDHFANHAPSGEETLYLGVKRLLPGHVLTWRDGQISIRRYWDVDFSKEGVESHDDETYIKRWSELFGESVRLRLMADVPLGMFLSGGIDSSAIAAVMSGMVSEPIKTFSVAFAEREANELEYARLIAEAYKTNHHEIVVTPEQFFAALPHLVWHEDEPLAHPSSVALYFVSKLASQHVKVVLTGEGSDELLAGYGRYRRTIMNLALGRRYNKLTPSIAKGMIRRQIQLLPNARVRQKLMRTFLVVSPELESIYFDNFAVFSTAMQQRMFTQETCDRIPALDPYVELRKLLARREGLSLLDGLLYADIKTYLHELLMKQDQMSMATSIESRVPFLDHKLVEFTAKMPDTMKLRGGTTKYVLRQSMKHILPERILSRSKMGFPVPIGSWFRGPFRSIVDEYILSDRAIGRGIFDISFVKQLVHRHQFDGEDHAERLWALVNFEMWLRQFFDGENPSESKSLDAELVHAT